ncbi:Sec-independent protein translocase subunit TatA [Corynebacterium glyciniphilum]|uniref:Sec-independent protein translocase subunit TatA n=1 Tax=Corynebacterium glyciniphilum TaxID=1404244 RepID=UPI00264C182D|nr:Sec-independent protein translocase subunit TatA [Corynebacterium glyciniphilum]MDN5685001.1 Sec-independent protein translocase subunit TatA [Corynebacterium glyciniphilum]MDN6704823.1 Sec-independent protein translocase subunit TatA [Corynebacterium glyciniphilum]
MPGATEWLIIALVVVLLFSAPKLPTMARSLGRSMRIFKSEMKEMKNDGTPVVPSAAPAPEPKVTPPSND